MTNSRGPVVVGMAWNPTPVEAIAIPTVGIDMSAAIDLAAREAQHRQIELRLVFGHDGMPPWLLAGQILDALVTRTVEACPALAVTAAIYPGSAAHALAIAAEHASLVVIAAQTHIDDNDAIANLVTGAMFAAPVVIVVTPVVVVARQEEPALTF